MSTEVVVKPSWWASVWAIAVLSSRANVRQPMVYVTLAAMPLSFFLVFTLVAGRSLGQHAFIGAAIAFAVTGGVVSLPQVVVVYRMRKLHEMIVASPIRPLTYLSGLALSRLLYIGPAVLIVLGAFIALGNSPVWRVVALVPCVLLAWMFGCAVGFAISRFWDDPAYIGSIANMIGYVLVLIPPVYYPLSLLPDVLQFPVSLVPTASLAELMRVTAGIGQAGLFEAAGHLLVVVAAIVACIWYGSGDKRWREP